MHEQGIGIWAFGWIFSEDEAYKTPQFWGTFMHLKVLSDDLGKVITIFYFKRICSRH